MMARSLLLFFLLACSALRAQTGKTYPDGHCSKVYLPLGDLAFADEVVSYSPGDPPPIDLAAYPKSALGVPDFNGGITGFVSLGCGGELVLHFTDNALVDIPGSDLYVFEVGKFVEKTNLYISKDGKTWLDAGAISGGKTEVDIGAVCKPYETFNYVKLVDLKDECRGNWPGADIDAVAAIGSGQRIQLQSAVLFEFDKYEVRQAAKPRLDSIAGLIAKWKNASVIISGHTDSTGTEEHNSRLSLNRAEAVKKYLLLKVKPAETRTFGLGSASPAASNTTEQGREKNRRVEIIIVPQNSPPH